MLPKVAPVLSVAVMVKLSKLLIELEALPFKVVPATAVAVMVKSVKVADSLPVVSANLITPKIWPVWLIANCLEFGVFGLLLIVIEPLPETVMVWPVTEFGEVIAEPLVCSWETSLVKLATAWLTVVSAVDKTSIKTSTFTLPPAGIFIAEDGLKL